jgi:ribosomal protein S19E (S16A)
MQNALLVISKLTWLDLTKGGEDQNSNPDLKQLCQMLTAAIRRIKIKIKIKIELLGSECHTSGTYAKRAKQEPKKDNAAACSYFLNYLVFIRPAADRVFPYFPGL